MNLDWAIRRWPDDIIRPTRKDAKMKPAKYLCLLAIFGAALLKPLLAAPPSPWEKPVADLAEQIASILGPGQAHLTIRNLSTLPNDEIPAIRRALAQDLKAHGVVMAGAESANTIRVTLSESAKERILVAEVGEGTQSQVAMVSLGPIAAQSAATKGELNWMVYPKIVRDDYDHRWYCLKGSSRAYLRRSVLISSYHEFLYEKTSYSSVY